jgi:hypothetical protein
MNTIEREGAPRELSEVRNPTIAEMRDLGGAEIEREPPAMVYDPGSIHDDLSSNEFLGARDPRLAGFQGIPAPQPVPVPPPRHRHRSEPDERGGDWEATSSAFVNLPSALNDNVPTMGEKEDYVRKCELLHTIRHLRSRGDTAAHVVLTTKDPVWKIEAELAQIRAEQQTTDGLESARFGFLFLASSLETASEYKPLNRVLSLQGWSKKLMLDVETDRRYDQVFLELIDKYRARMPSSPESKLLWLVASSAFTFSMASKMADAALKNDGGRYTIPASAAGVPAPVVTTGPGTGSAAGAAATGTRATPEQLMEIMRTLQQQQNRQAPDVAGAGPVRIPGAGLPVQNEKARRHKSRSDASSSTGSSSSGSYSSVSVSSSSSHGHSKSSGGKGKRDRKHRNRSRSRSSSSGSSGWTSSASESEEEERPKKRRVVRQLPAAPKKTRRPQPRAPATDPESDAETVQTDLVRRSIPKHLQGLVRTPVREKPAAGVEPVPVVALSVLGPLPDASDASVDVPATSRRGRGGGRPGRGRGGRGASRAPARVVSEPELDSASGSGSGSLSSDDEMDVSSIMI